ncbi:MAG: apolipoprotein N-acyltransferase [Vicinamibacterales bacterium]
MDRSLALLSGALLALSFPRYGHGIVAFIALVPLFVALSGWHGRPGRLPGVSVRRGFQLGLLAGFVHFAGTVYWTGATVSTFGGLPWVVGIAVAGLLVLYMALFVGAACAATAVLVRGLGGPGLLLAPAAWVAAEYARGHLFGGFPWIPLGNTMIGLLPIAQLASLVGVYGLSWYVATLNAGFALAAVSHGRPRVVAAGGAFALILAASVWGAARMGANTLVREGTPITVGLIQGNVPQDEKWDPGRAGDIVRRYMALSRDAVGGGAQLLVWPESSTPFVFDNDPAGASVVRGLVSSLGTPLLFGSDEIERGDRLTYYNSAYMLDPAGATAAVYRKMQLVPFGEYVPFKDALFFVQPLVEAVAAFTPGTRVTMLPVDGHMMSTAICYEVVYPHLIRQGVLNGAELLSTITNDAWYGHSSAPFQHFEQAAMRAVEQGRYLIRAANTGISGIVDPYGRVLARTALDDTTALVGQARFVQALTLYARIGDLAPQLAVLLTLAGLAAASWRRA